MHKCLQHKLQVQVQVQPEEVAALAWFLTTQAPAMTGTVVMIDNGLHLLT